MQHDVQKAACIAYFFIAVKITGMKDDAAYTLFGTTSLYQS